MLILGGMSITREEYDKACQRLSVPPEASAETLQKAWRAYAFAKHPDRGGDAAEFSLVSAAWEQLKQANFQRPPPPSNIPGFIFVEFEDLFRPHPSPRGGPAPRPSGRPTYPPPSGSPGWRGSRPTAEPPRPFDAIITITLAESIHGCQKSVDLPGWIPCPASTHPPYGPLPTSGETPCVCDGFRWVPTGKKSTFLVTLPRGAGFNTTEVGRAMTRLTLAGQGAPRQAYPNRPADRGEAHLGVECDPAIGPVTVSRGAPGISQIVSRQAGMLSAVFGRVGGLEIVLRMTLDITDALLGGEITVETAWGASTVDLPPFAKLLQTPSLPLPGLPGIPTLSGAPSLGCSLEVTIVNGSWTAAQTALLTHLRDLRTGAPAPARKPREKKPPRAAPPKAPKIPGAPRTRKPKPPRTSPEEPHE